MRSLIYAMQSGDDGNSNRLDADGTGSGALPSSASASYDLDVADWCVGSSRRSRPARLDGSKTQRDHRRVPHVVARGSVGDARSEDAAAHTLGYGTEFAFTRNLAGRAWVATRDRRLRE